MVAKEICLMQRWSYCNTHLYTEEEIKDGKGQKSEKRVLVLTRPCVLKATIGDTFIRKELSGQKDSFIHPAPATTENKRRHIKSCAATWKNTAMSKSKRGRAC